MPPLFLIDPIGTINEYDSLSARRSIATNTLIFLFPPAKLLLQCFEAWFCFLNRLTRRYVNSKTQSRLEGFLSLSRVQPHLTTGFLFRTVRLQFQSCELVLNRGLTLFFAKVTSTHYLSL